MLNKSVLKVLMVVPRACVTGPLNEGGLTGVARLPPLEHWCSLHHLVVGVVGLDVSYVHIRWYVVWCFMIV